MKTIWKCKGSKNSALGLGQKCAVGYLRGTLKPLAGMYYKMMNRLLPWYAGKWRYMPNVSKWFYMGIQRPYANDSHSQGRLSMNFNFMFSEWCCVSPYARYYRSSGWHRWHTTLPSLLTTAARIGLKKYHISSKDIAKIVCPKIFTHRAIGVRSLHAYMRKTQVWGGTWKQL